MILEQLIGQVLDDKYLIDKKLGQGGMGAVYLATHIGTKRPVAVKVISPQFMENTNFVERFKREAEAAGRLRHPNVVNVTDFGFTEVGDDKVAYLVMEYLDGKTLGDLLETEKTLPLQFVVDIVEQVCLAVDRAHGLGIIHRDLKPDNIWLEPNGRGGFNVKVLDFGLAKLRSSAPSERSIKPGASGTPARALEAAAANDSEIEPATVLKTNPDETDTMLIEKRAPTNERKSDTAPGGGLTMAGDLLGTPLYMSPEQCGGGELDGRSDIYSLGIIIYQMLSGETPFKGSLYSLITSHVQKTPPSLKEKISGIPDPVAGLVMSALAKNPEDRPPNASAFGTAFRVNASGESSILRQAITLYSEHFFEFIRISLIGYSPMMTGIMVFFIGMLVPALHKPAIVTFFVLFFFLMQLINNAVTGGVVVPMVAHFTQSPLEPFRIEPVIAAFRSRFKAYLFTSLIAHKKFMLYVALPIIVSTALPLSADTWAYWIIQLALFIITGLLLRSEFLLGRWLYTPVTVWENLQGKASLERSKNLIARLEGTLGNIFPLIVFVIINVSILAIMVSWSLIKSIGKATAPAESAVEITAAALGVTLSIVLYTLLCPLIAIGYALFYLKARQAGGETIMAEAVY